MSNTSNVHTRMATHLRDALRSPMGLGMYVAMFLLMG